MHMFVAIHPPMEIFMLLKYFLTLGSRPTQGLQGCSHHYCICMLASWYFTRTTIQPFYTIAQD